MTRDEFEAIVWRTFPDATVAQVDAALAAADTFAATTAAVALELEGHGRDRLPSVHYQNPMTREKCCHYGSRNSEAVLTTDPGQVTCKGCKKSRSYRNALALAVAS